MRASLPIPVTDSVTFTLYNVPADVTGTIATDANPVTLTTTAIGENMSLTFPGTAAQRIVLQTQMAAGGPLDRAPCAPLTIIEPDGATQLYRNGCYNDPSVYSDVLILPVAGTYTIQAGLPIPVTDSLTFTLYNVPPDSSATITPGGGTVSLTTTAIGQDMSLTFAGTAGERVSLLTQMPTGGPIDAAPCFPLTISKPDGTQLYLNGCFNDPSVFSDVLVLPVAGTYRIYVNLTPNVLGTVSFTLYDVPPDASGTTSLGAATTNYSTTVPGQAIRVGFAGTAGQGLHVNVGVVSSSPANPCFNITTLNPNGTTLRGDQSCSASYTSGALTMAQTGTYTVVIDPTSTSIGTFSLAVTSP
jgi:hypothetical protein